MAQASVRELLDQIEKLSEADRCLLDEHLADRAEAEWLRLTSVAAEVAHARGIDQAAIDAAVEEDRYPGADGQAR